MFFNISQPRVSYYKGSSFSRPVNNIKGPGGYRSERSSCDHIIVKSICCKATIVTNQREQMVAVLKEICEMIFKFQMITSLNRQPLSEVDN